MSIGPVEAYPPHPATTRAQSASIAYDKVNDRIAYPLGRSIFVKPVGENENPKVKSFQFTKHVHTTTAVAFSSNGNYIASGDESGQVKIWDTSVFGDKDPLVEQPTIKCELQILSGPIKSISWDGDNTRLIAVGDGKEKFGHCFSWDTGNSVGEIQGHSDVVNSVAIKPQRPYRAATVGNDKALVFYNGPPFKFDKSIRDYHTNIIRDVLFSPDGKYLVSVGSDRLIVVYDGKTGDFIKKIENSHTGGIFGVSWFEDSTQFVTCSADNSVKVWSCESFELTKTLKVSEEVSVPNQLVAVVVTKKYIIAVSLSGNLIYFDDDSVKIIEGHQSAITSSVVAGSGSELITGGSNGGLFKWDVKKESSTLAPIPQKIGDATSAHSNYVSDVIEFKDKLVSIGWDDKLKVWDQTKLVSEIQLSAQPKKLSTSGGNLEVLFENSIESYTIDGSTITKGTETKLNYDSNDIEALADQLLVTNLLENKIEDPAKKLSFDAIRGTPSIMKASPDDKYVVLGDSSGKYMVYNSDSSVKTTRWVFHTGKVLDCKWSPDSKFLLSGGLDTTIIIYCIDKLTKVTKFPLAHQTGISRVEWLDYDFDTTGRATIATTGLDGIIKLWTVDLAAYK